MPPYRGRFNQKGLPVIEVEVIGERGFDKVIAVVDSGYNGFLSVNYGTEQATKLKRLGVESANMANGIPTTYLECLGTIVIGDIRVKTVIDVQQKGQVLLGNAFLKEARLCLLCDPYHSLVELNYLEKI